MVSTFNMSGLVNVQSDCKSPVALEPRTLLVTRQTLQRIAFTRRRSAALDFLLLRLAFTSDEYLAIARFALLTGKRSMARCLVWMAAHLLLFATRLRACLAASILALTFAMTLLAAKVHTTL